MLESKSDIWDSGAHYICVTTNGIVKSNGELVMGAGIAKQARDRYPRLARVLGNYVNDVGNVPCYYVQGSVKPIIVSLPTKHHWKDKSDLNLIIESLRLIKANTREGEAVALTRPGCALGGLDWETVVKPAIEPLLDNRFTVYYQ